MKTQRYNYKKYSIILDLDDEEEKKISDFLEKNRKKKNNFSDQLKKAMKKVMAEEGSNEQKTYV